MSLPLAHDFNPYEDLDGNSALQHFLGQTLDDAVRLFEDNFPKYQEDLLFMGPTAFCFYFSAAVQYAESPSIEIESDVADLMLMVMRYPWEFDRDKIQSIRVAMLQYCQGVLDRIPQMDPDFWNRYGDLEAKFSSFIIELNSN